MSKKIFLELFAGAGGLSEGFINNGYQPIAFIEKDKYCCDTLKTRQAYHHLKENNTIDIYHKYLSNIVSKDDLFNQIPKEKLNIILNQEINKKSINFLLDEIKNKLMTTKLDLILGGPPCQAYSLIGRAQNKLKTDDERLFLYKYYLQFLKEFKPTTFIFENVPGLLSIDKGNLFESIVKDFENLGYHVNFEILNSNDYGVLQTRKRLIVIGNLNHKVDFSQLKKNKLNFNVSSLFLDLKPLKPNEVKNEYISLPNAYLKKSMIRNKEDVLTLHSSRPHNKRDLEIYKRTIELWNKNKARLKYSDLPDKLKTHNNEKSFLDRFKVVSADLEASHTLVAHIAKDGHHYIHPDINQCRSISVREAARIQSFPDNFFFEGPRTSQFTQIGNAVPPLLSQHLANTIKMHYEA